MTKEEIAGVLEHIATLLELKDENPFKVRAYTNAARAIETFGANVSSFQDEEAVEKIPGIGKSIALKIKELAETGSLKYFQELTARISHRGFWNCFRCQGLARRRSRRSTTNSGSVLSSSCRRRANMGASLSCRALAKQRSKNSVTLSRDARRTPVHFNLARSQLTRNRCVPISPRTSRHCMSMLPGAIGDEKRLCMISICWWRQTSRRRWQNFSFPIRWLSPSSRKVRRNRASGCVPAFNVICEWSRAAEYPFALAYFTGNKEHNIEMRSRALKRGWTLNEYRLAPVPLIPKAKKKKTAEENSTGAR